ncbi:hypothetical protein RC74_09080 [Falsihalocynthiibacter arcticus]|uniref:Uncharacterized protein n=1 Tax=Falsihalocynthiibacter arcticus TaxID=1579316 RepID=A0A126V0B3_9RHOB|nr:hypothetical protein RC74_09080 [Falsihalocynthiibacter arcticus]
MEFLRDVTDLEVFRPRDFSVARDRANKRPQQGGFARTVRSHKGDDFTVLYVKIDGIQRCF